MVEMQCSQRNKDNCVARVGLFLETILIIWYSACFEVNCVYYQVYLFQIIMHYS